MKKYFIGLLLLSAMIGSPSPASGGPQWPGMDLVAYCTGDAYLFDPSTCRTYIQGVTDAYKYFDVQGKHPKSFCLPDDA